jgi:hypothetical protein
VIAFAALRPLSAWSVAAAVAAMVVAAALVLAAMGHPWICTCGVVRLWSNDVNGAENSQQIADWYTWTHLIHGLLFYFGLWLVARRLPLSWRLLAATVIECGWEILENSPLIIERYRAGTISLNYFGDSVLNSVTDVLAMILGFWLAAKLPVWASIALALAIEVVLALTIRDNLTLNVLMLVWPLAAVRNWQAGGG